MTTNHPSNELEKILKQLKLSGMLQTLSARTREAAAGQLSHGDYLSLLAQDELLNREQRRYGTRFKKAGFKGQKTIENFDFDFNPKINRSMINDLSTCRFIQECHPVIIVGPCGTGKTHIAQALGLCAIQQGFDVLCVTQTELSDKLLAAKAINGYSKALAAIAKIKLLIIDDFGLKPLQSLQDEIIHDVISTRYEHAATIVTSNLAVNEWSQAFPNQLLGAATIDRILHNAYTLKLEGKSFRSAKNKKMK
jgi:DNA replication protein DnaC